MADGTGKGSRVTGDGSKPESKGGKELPKLKPRERKYTRKVIGRNATKKASSHKKSQDKQKWVWDDRKRAVAVAIAEDDFSDREIAAVYEVNLGTLHQWKGSPEFCAEVDRLQRDIWQRLSLFGYFNREKRLQRLHRLLERCRAVMHTREKVYSASLEQVSDTAIESLRSEIEALKPRIAASDGEIRKGLMRERSQLLEELWRLEDGREQGTQLATGVMRKVLKKEGTDIVFDSALVKEERELLKQIAIELREWNEKKTEDDDDGGDAELLNEVLALAGRLRGSGASPGMGSGVGGSGAASQDRGSSK